MARSDLHYLRCIECGFIADAEALEAMCCPYCGAWQLTLDPLPAVIDYREDN